MERPTTIAARKSRPARDVSVAGCCLAPRAGCSAGFPVPASLVVTDFVAERPLDLQQLAFFVFNQLINLGDVLVRGLVEILFCATDLILAGLAFLTDAMEFLHRFATDITHRNLGLLPLCFACLTSSRRRSSVSCGTATRIRAPSLVGFTPRSELRIAVSIARN